MMRARLLLIVGIVVGHATAGAQTPDLSELDIPKGFLKLSDVTIDTRSDRTVTATAYTTLLNASAYVLISSAPPATAGARRGVIVGLKPDDWSLGKSIPQLAGPPIGDLTLSNIGLVITNEDVDESSDLLPEADYDFYRELYQQDDYELVLKPGINLIAAIPIDRLDPDSPLLSAMNALGMEKGPVLLQGTLGKSMALIGGPGGGGANVLKDLYLRAQLPAMHPAGSPAWFRSGQLALELTGAPSVRLVGEMTVHIDDDDLKFFLATSIGRTGLALSGGLAADSTGWRQPFGISWLVLKKVVLQLAITPAGSVEPGFAGRMIIGDKDIDVAMALAISPAGVPTSFMIKGESEAGVGLSDLVKLQRQMAAARATVAEAGGQPASAATALDLSSLPDVEFRSLGLKFAPKALPELGVERGMNIKGRMWLRLSPTAGPTDFAGVDVGVSDDGLWARGDLGAFSLGPLRWDDATLDLTATREAQHFLLKGDAQLFGARQAIDVSLTRKGLSFATQTRLFDLFSADLKCESVFNLRNPSFTVDGVVQNDFGQVLGPLFQDGFVRFAAGADEVAGAARTAADDLDRALSNAQQTTDQLRALLEARRRHARDVIEAVRGKVAAAERRANAARRARDAAWRAFTATPARRVALRSARRAAYASAKVRYLAAASAYAGLRAGLSARQAILDAMPPVDRNIALMAANAATAALRERLAIARDRLRVLEERFTAVGTAVARGDQLISIERGQFHGALSAAMGGGAIDWDIAGSFVGRPFEVKRALDFSNAGEAAAGIVDQLLRS